MMAERSLHDVSTSSSLQVLVVVPNSIEDTKLIRGALPFFTELPLIKLHRGEWLLFLSQIPGTTQHKMLVRPCLREIAGGILVGSCPPQQKKKHFVVSGSAGVGKTFFLWYLMWRLVQAKRRVLFLTSNPPVHFDGRTMWTYSGSILPDEYLSPDLICLMDFAGDCSGYKNTLLKKKNLVSDLLALAAER